MPASARTSRRPTSAESTRASSPVRKRSGGPRQPSELVVALPSTPSTVASLLCVTLGLLQEVGSPDMAYLAFLHARAMAVAMGIPEEDFWAVANPLAEYRDRNRNPLTFF